jgi:3-methyladenine DNA glycosylase AlkD
MDRADETLERLRAVARSENLAGMARYGIEVSSALGVPIPELRAIAKGIGHDHALALALWRTGVHEARILASMIDDPAATTVRQMDAWARTFDSWDVCDQVCANLFDRTPHAIDRIRAWAPRPETFVRRAAFATLAGLTVHRRDVSDAELRSFLPLIERASDDDRNYVRKAVSWALRQIGKRNPALNADALAAAERIRGRGTRAARWIASDVLRELTSETVRGRLERRAATGNQRSRTASARSRNASSPTSSSSPDTT